MNVTIKDMKEVRIFLTFVITEGGHDAVRANFVDKDGNVLPNIDENIYSTIFHAIENLVRCAGGIPWRDIDKKGE